MFSPTHLIIVCGHAIWLGGPKNGWDESEWLIESYKKGETPTFIQHIRAGIEALANDTRAVLVFSGGPTRKETELSEAASYHNLAIANSYFGFTPTDDLKSRILLDERALDSYYNILFSTILFWRTHGSWPKRLTVVSHGFKRNRLVDGHCAAIGYPAERVDFIGINPPVMGGQVGAEKADAMRGVHLTIGQWVNDPHGVGEDLAGKRRQRNVWGVSQLLFSNEEERLRSGVNTISLEDGSEALAGSILQLASS